METCITCGVRHNPQAACPRPPLNAAAPNVIVPAGGEPTDPSAAAALAMAPSPPSAGAPAGLQLGGTVPRNAAINGLSEDDLYRMLSAAHRGNATPEIRAALQDITQTAVGVDVEQPDFVGQLWQGADYVRKVVPLIAGPALRSFKITGWRWTTKPAVAAWAEAAGEDKVDVPSNQPATEPYEVEADRLAGAHDIDRKFRDFGDTAFFEAYYRAMTDSYRRLSDAAAVDGIEAVATDIAAPAYVGFLGAIAAGVAAIDDATNVQTTFVLANKADLIPWALATTNFDVPAFLSMIGVDPNRIVTHNSVTAGHILVGTSAAINFRELPGVPIRVEAIDMVKGGVDTGVFGYYAMELHDATGLQDVTIDTTP